MKHDFDEDAVCVHCGFDGAEWWHWKHQTYEGKASDTKQPTCTEFDQMRRADNLRRYLPSEPA